MSFFRFIILIFAFLFTLIYFNILFTDYINSKTMFYKETNEEFENKKSKLKLVICFAISISWAVFIFVK